MIECRFVIQLEEPEIPWKIGDKIPIDGYFEVTKVISTAQVGEEKTEYEFFYKLNNLGRLRRKHDRN